jgi:serine/threonine-protein kinase
MDVGREAGGSTGDGGGNHPQRGSSSGARAGSIVAGRYRVERTLGEVGEGGAGDVVEATDLGRKERVVVKFLSQIDAVPPELALEFLRENATIARLQSEYAARVLDAGISDHGALYLVREYLAGQSVARTLRTLGPLPLTRATEYTIQACEALNEAHSQGIVHGDIKPYNLYLAGQVGRSPLSGSVRIVDFGISKFAFSSRHSIVTSMVIGYLPPERLRADGTADHRSDIWSLGATLYELLTGQAAFDTSQTLGRVVTAILDEPSPCPRRARPDIPEELAAIVRRCLSKSAEARFQSAKELAIALLPWSSSCAQIVAEQAGWIEAMPEVATSPFELVQAHQPAQRTESIPPEQPTRRANSPSLAPVTKTLVGMGAVSASIPAAGEARRTPEGGEAEIETEVPLYSVPRWLAAASMMLAGAVVFSAIVLSANDRGGEKFGSGAAFAAQPQNAAPAVRHEPLKAGPPSVAPEIFQLVVKATPSSAEITIDGTVVEGNPYRALYPKGGDPHRVTVSADGYESMSEEVSLSSDITLNLDLKRDPLLFENRSPPPARPVPSPSTKPSAETAGSATAEATSSSPSSRNDSSASR